MFQAGEAKSCRLFVKPIVKISSCGNLEGSETSRKRFVRVVCNAFFLETICLGKEVLSRAEESRARSHSISIFASRRQRIIVVFERTICVNMLNGDATALRGAWQLGSAMTCKRFSLRTHEHKGGTLSVPSARRLKPS